MFDLSIQFVRQTVTAVAVLLVQTTTSGTTQQLMVTCTCAHVQHSVMN